MGKEEIALLGPKILTNQEKRDFLSLFMKVLNLQNINYNIILKTEPLCGNASICFSSLCTMQLFSATFVQNIQKQ